jgi:hypothetical protein
MRAATVASARTMPPAVGAAKKRLIPSNTLG